MMSAWIRARSAQGFGVAAVTVMFLFSLAAAVGQDDALREPPAVISADGRLVSPLTVLFGTIKIPGIGEPDEVSVRAYGLEPPDTKDGTKPLVPGPTFVFHPGDLVRIHLHNYLNRASNPALNLFEDQPQTGPGPGAADDINEHVAHEISIPNNADITNLHVHGLHVDPKQDDVTLLILPEDTNPSDLAPEMQRLVPTINRWWVRPYQYKIPADHMPGTFWYHSHKHGSTATQVENGMAGTLVMLPNNDADSIVPGLWNNDQSKTHDRVLVLQGVMNFGTPQGAGQGPLANVNLGNPLPTVNGQFQPTLKLPAGQLERWRFVFAGANHRAAGCLWVGKILPPPPTLPPDLESELLTIKTKADGELYYKPPPGSKKFSTSYINVCVKVPGAVKLVAVDGVTMWQAVDISPSSPTFGAAGNRNDLLIQVDKSAATSGPYYVYQNFPLLTQSTLAMLYPQVFDSNTFGAEAVTARYNALTKGATTKGQPAYLFVEQVGNKQTPVPNAMTTDPYALGTQYMGLMKPWATVDADGNANRPAPQSMAPLLNGQVDNATNGVKANIRAQNFPADPGWQPMGAGVGQPAGAGIMMSLDISGTPTGPTMPSDAALNARLSLLSPATKNFNPNTTLMRNLNKHGQLVPGIPSYVAPVPDIFDGHQVVVFDRGQFTFDYVNTSNGTLLQFRQFWLNGRQFSPDDFVGNPDSTRLIQSSIVNLEPHVGSYSPNAAETLWTHRVGTGLGEKLLITNPAYYLPVKSLGANGFNYDYSQALNGKVPSYNDVTGLTAPSQPQSTTAEEWLLINNSDMYHPFHIHISPFFVEEIGQVNYNANTTGPQWTLKNLSDSDSPFKWVAGNWWDVILLPPHGYVKMKTWMNFPVQAPENNNDPRSDLYVIENANGYGSWVLHCHILRHEDRGMMTMVNTKPKPVSLAGKWFAPTGPAVELIDDDGNLTVMGIAGTTVAGNFNQGLGNPFMNLPWAGAMSFTANGTTTTKTFNVTDNAAEIVFSDGTRWTKTQQPLSPAVTPINLSGNWGDSDNNVASIQQVQNGTVYNLTFTPESEPPVWWAKGTGSWPAGVSGDTNPLAFAGTQTLVNNAGRNQQLSFCVTADGNSIVFGNGIKWTRK